MMGHEEHWTVTACAFALLKNVPCYKLQTRLSSGLQGSSRCLTGLLGDTETFLLR